jgi:parvulin-like peptidyl-prolyl isomerase
MSSEFSSAPEEPRDYTKYIWAAIIVLLVIMFVAFAMYGGRRSIRTEARAKHILVRFEPNNPVDRARALELIKDIRQQLIDGSMRNFGELARQHSEDPGTRTRGGDLGYSRPGEFADEIDNYIWTAPLNELSGVIETSYGYHLVIVTDRHISEVDRYERRFEEETLKGAEDT